METLRLGAKGDDVKTWQTFLRGANLYMGEIDGAFGPRTLAATQAFQRAHALADDGVVGNRTVGVAMQLGLHLVPDDPTLPDSLDFPPKPAFAPLDEAGRRALFGNYDFKPAPTPENPEGIQILGNWFQENVQVFVIPELAQVEGAHGGKIPFHKLVGPKVQELFARWSQEGLASKVLGFGGSFAPRFIRGSRTILSAHAHASAFDINVPWNPLGAAPALRGAKGSVRELVPIANELGFYWGGHFTRRDGMHFEMTVL
jgi:hypothetical protein